MFIRNLRYYSKKISATNVINKNDSKKTDDKKKCDKIQTKTDEKSDSPSNDEEKAKKSESKIKVPSKLVNVSILGANVKAGITTSLLLKQCSLVKQLSLFGTDYVKYMGEDLSLIDTNTRVYAYNKPTELNQVLSASDIVVIIDTDWKNYNAEKKFHRAFNKIKFFAKKIRFHCPRALIINCVEPVCCTTMLLHILLKSSPLYKFNRLIGSVAPLQCRVNQAAGRYLGMNPEYVHIPIFGGPSFGTFVPVLRSMTPNPELPEIERLKLFRYILKKIDLHETYRRNRSLFCEGVAIAKLTTKVAKALVGEQNIYASCFIRNHLLQTKSSFVTTVRFGREGVDKIYPVPKMEGYEIYEFMKSISNLYRKEKYIKKFCERFGLYNKFSSSKKYALING